MRQQYVPTAVRCEPAGERPVNVRCTLPAGAASPATKSSGAIQHRERYAQSASPALMLASSPEVNVPTGDSPAVELAVSSDSVPVAWTPELTAVTVPS